MLRTVKEIIEGFDKQIEEIKVLRKKFTDVYTKYPNAQYHGYSYFSAKLDASKINKIQIVNNTYSSISIRKGIKEEKIWASPLDTVILELRRDYLDSHGYRGIIKINNYEKAIPDHIKNKKLWIRKIERKMVQFINKTKNAELDPKCYNLEKFQHFLLLM